MTSRPADAARLAARIAKVESRQDALARASQLTRSTLDIDGVPTPVPAAIASGARAGAIAEQVRADLDEAREHLDSSLGELDTRLTENETRTEAAEGRIADAFSAADQAQQDAAAALAAAEAAIGANAIADPGFETPSMWTDRLADAGPRFSIATTGARSGAGALQVTEGASEAIIALGSTPVKVGMVLRFRAWVNTPSGLTSSERPVVEYVDQTGAVVSSTPMPSGSATGAWALWSSSLTTTEANAAVTAITAQLRFRHTTARTILLDDLELVDYTSAQELAGSVNTSIQQKPAIFYRTDLPGATYAAVGSTWFQTDAAGNVVAQLRQTAATIGNPPVIGADWRPTEITSEVIANLDVGKLRAGSAEINDLVAQRFAAKAGQFIELDVSQLTASDAAFNEAVADKLWSDEFVTRLATAQQLIAGDAIIENSITADKLAANTLWVNNLDVGEAGANVLPATSVSTWTLPSGSTRRRRMVTVDGGQVLELYVVAGGADDGASLTSSKVLSIADVADRTLAVSFQVRLNVASSSPSSPLGATAFVALYNAAGSLVTILLPDLDVRPVNSLGTWEDREAWFRIPRTVENDDGMEAVATARIMLGAGTPLAVPMQFRAIDARVSMQQTYISRSVVSSRTVAAETVSSAGLVQGAQFYGGAMDLTSSIYAPFASFDSLYTDELRMLPSAGALLTITPDDMRRMRDGGTTTDWNTATETGFYTSVSSASNAPQSSFAMMGTVIAAPAGYIWQEVREAGNNHNSSWYRYRTSAGVWTAWRKAGPVTGTYTAGNNILAGEFFDQVITFPAGQFTSAPKVIAGTNQVRVLVACTAKSSTQATLRVFNVSSGTAGGTCTVDWTATA